MPGDCPPDRMRRIRSFVRRPGRLTPAQARALTELLPAWQVEDSIRDLRRAFDRTAPLVMEIGFGNGQALAWMAAREPDTNFVGVEVHEPGVGRLLNMLESEGLTNVRVAMRDAVEVFDRQVADASIDQVRIYFPDPWPKKRHHKRRLIQPEFVARLCRCLVPSGLVNLATDWPEYRDWMLEVLEAETRLVNCGDPWVERPAWRPRTHFERRGEQRGHEIRDLLFRRV